MFKVLCVDDELLILESFKRILSRTYEVHTSTDSLDALEVLEKKGPFEIIISDMHMPGMDGLRFIDHAKKISPNTVCILLTGDKTQDTAIEALNSGKIFQFLSKPCPPKELLSTIDKALEAYNVQCAEKKILEDTLTTCIEVFSNMLSLANPLAFSKAQPIRDLSLKIAKKMNVAQAWEIKIAVILCQLGYVTLTHDTLEKYFKGTHLTTLELQMVQNHTIGTSKIISKIPKLECITEVIRLFQKPYSTIKMQNGCLATTIAAIINAADAYIRLLNQNKSPEDALSELAQNTGFHPTQVITAMAECIEDTPLVQKPSHLELHEIREGMVLAEDIITQTSGIILVPKGQHIDPTTMQRISNYHTQGLTSHRVCVFNEHISKEPAALN